MTDSQDSVHLHPPDPGPLRRAREFVVRVFYKADEDNIFFMAGAITFNLLVAIIPLILLFIGVSGFVLTSRFPDPASVLIPFLLGNLPTVGGDVDLVSRVQGVIDMLLEDRAGFSLAGSLIFIWVATRLVGTLRTALREVFDFSHGRGIVRGKLFDAFMVVVGGVLFTVNVGITVLVEAVESYGVNLIGLEGTGLSTFRQVSAQALAFGFIWALFLLIYRYLPPRRIPWRTALTAATFTGVLFEATKYLFSWYVTNAANFTTVYGGLTSAAILFFWIYYGAVVFILGGEVAQVSTMSRIRRLHAENALPNGAASG
jgi:membrane protein